MSDRSKIQAGFERFPGMKCFACSPLRLNPSGLHLVFEETPEGAKTSFSIPKHFQSYPRFVHGGILCAIIDETMAYAGIFKRHLLPFTMSVQLRYRHWVETERKYICAASVVELFPEGFKAKAAIKTVKNASLVLATGKFSTPTLEMAEKMMGIEWKKFGEWFRR